ncbi:MAG: hydroxyacid dehydrogenase [Candidatus Moranbacteria bacterium]|nr:hydroxyacid dehydrogenase [Candidatus Moranbacteria bacterium]
MKIAVFEIKKWEKKIFQKKIKEADFYFSPNIVNPKELKKIKDAQILSVFIYSKIDKKVLKQLPRLKAIATRSTGFDHIDLRECQKRKIKVFNVPFYGENTVAEHTFGLILSLSRNIHKSYLRTQRNDFSIQGLKGFDLKGRTLGVVGAGHIGLHVIRIAKSFGMEILAFDVHEDKFLAEVLDFKYLPFKEVLKKSDIISLHVPYNKHTHHLINRKSIKLFKKGSILINTARGKIVETEALIEALDKGILSGAGLDVLEGEELIKEDKQLLYDQEKMDKLGSIIKDHILLNMENVVFTPHIAFYSQEAQERIIETTIENIVRYLTNKKAKTDNLVEGKG